MSDLRERCIGGMAVNDHPDLLKVAEHHLDRLLDVLEESAEEIGKEIGDVWFESLVHSSNRLGAAHVLRGLLSVLRGNGE